MKMRKKGSTVNYFNDLLKAYKVYFRYAYEEGYTETLLTEKIQNAKGDKVINGNAHSYKATYNKGDLETLLTKANAKYDLQIEWYDLGFEIMCTKILQECGFFEEKENVWKNTNGYKVSLHYYLSGNEFFVAVGKGY